MKTLTCMTLVAFGMVLGVVMTTGPAHNWWGTLAFTVCAAIIMGALWGGAFLAVNDFMPREPEGDEIA